MTSLDDEPCTCDQERRELERIRFESAAREYRDAALEHKWKAEAFTRNAMLLTGFAILMIPCFLYLGFQIRMLGAEEANEHQVRVTMGIEVPDPSLYDNPRLTSFSNMFFTGALFIVIFGVVALAALAFAHPSLNVARLQKRGDLGRASTPGSKRLEAAMHEIAERMGIRDVPTMLIARKDLSCVPSLGQLSGVPVVVVPIGMVTRANRSPALFAQARGLLSHELAHALQADIRLWSDSVAYARVSGPLVWLGAAMTIFVAVSGHFLGSMSVLIVGGRAFTWANKRVISARRESEMLADRAAAIFDDGDALADALESLVVDSRSRNGLHPLVKERAAHLRSYAHELSLRGFLPVRCIPCTRPFRNRALGDL